MPNLEVIQFTGQNSDILNHTESQEVQLYHMAGRKSAEVFGEKQ